MQTAKWMSSLMGVVLLGMALLLGCTLQPPDGAEEGGWHIQLNINPPVTAKAITVAEHDVAGLTVAVYDPDNQLIDTITWEAEEGSMSYKVPVTQEGQHEIVVTHISEENGQVVEATESALFNIQAMVITVIDITPGFIGVIDVSGGGEEPDKEDGTLTVSLTGVEAVDGTSVLTGVYPAGVDPGPDPLSTIEAMGHDELTGGAVVSTMTEPDSDVTWIGTGGSFYDVYTWVDINDNLDMVMYPEPGIDWQLAFFPVTVEIDGNTSLEFQGSDFVVVPPSP